MKLFADLVLAAANLALQLGIKPVFVDIDEDTFALM